MQVENGANLIFATSRPSSSYQNIAWMNLPTKGLIFIQGLNIQGNNHHTGLLSKMRD